MSITLQSIKWLFYTMLFCTVGFSLIHSIFNLKNKSRVTQVANEFVSTVNYAQKKAIHSQRAVKITPINGYWKNGWSVVTLDGKVLRRYMMNEQSNRMTHASLQVKQIAFSSSGLTKSLQPLGNKGLYICDSMGQGKNLKMIASGYVTVQNLNSGCVS